MSMQEYWSLPAPERVILGRSAAEARQPDETIGGALSRLLRDPKYVFLYHKEKLIGFQLRDTLSAQTDDHLTCDITPMGVSECWWISECWQREQFLDGTLASLS